MVVDMSCCSNSFTSKWIGEISTFEHSTARANYQSVWFMCLRNWVLNVDTTWFTKNDELLQVILFSIFWLQNLNTFSCHIFLQLYIFIKFIKCFSCMFQEYFVHKLGFVIGKYNKVMIAITWIFCRITNITALVQAIQTYEIHCFWRVSCATFPCCILHKGIHWEKSLYHILYLWPTCFLNISY